MKSSNIWDGIWTKDSYSLPGLREKKAIKKINLMYKSIEIDNNMTFIDMGCGGGYISKQIYLQNKCNIIGVDFSAKAIQLAKENCKNLPIIFLNNPINKVELPDRSADVVACFGSLEHIEDIDSVLFEIIRILKNNGIIFVTSSNKKSIMYIHRKIKEVLKLWKYGYQKNWTPIEMKKHFEMLGFCSISCKVDLGIGDFKLITFFDSLIRFFNKNWGRYIIYVGRKL
jgi:2-polyprenyl-3-methyl-5-hydroxy-6-metoxy-1,4-benzoquinol methylase